MLNFTRYCLLLFLCSIISCCKKKTSEPDPLIDLELTYFKTGLPHQFMSVHFVDDSTGYLCSYQGGIFKTVDGGTNWVEQNSNTTLPLLDLFFINANVGFAVGGESSCEGDGCTAPGAVILKTINGGQTWSQLPVTPIGKIEFKSIYFPSDSVGCLIGGTILSTKDQGLTWKETIVNNVGGSLMEVEFANEKDGLIVCSFGKLLKTSDGGINWKLTSPFPELGGYCLSMVNKELIYSAGYIKIEKSTDFGDSWYAKTYPPAPMAIHDLVFLTDKLGYAFGKGQYSGGDFGHNYGAIYGTMDGGQTWAGNDTIHNMGQIESAFFTKDDLGYAVSGNVVVRIRRR